MSAVDCGILHKYWLASGHTFMASLTTDNSTSTKKSSTDILLVIFIHGFKGTDETFREFPQRLQHVLSETVDNILVECTIFPAYEVNLFRPPRFSDSQTQLLHSDEGRPGRSSSFGMIQGLTNRLE